MKIFKVLSVMMIIALSAGFTSCGSDDEEENVTLVGTWELAKEQTTVTKPDGSVEKRPEETPEGSTVIVFNADKTGALTSDDYHTATTWSLDGSKLTIIDEDEDIWEFDVLSLNNNQAVLRDVFKDGDWSFVTVTTYTRVK